MYTLHDQTTGQDLKNVEIEFKVRRFLNKFIDMSKIRTVRVEYDKNYSENQYLKITISDDVNIDHIVVNNYYVCYKLRNPVNNVTSTIIISRNF